jgi:hypothetical protein
VVERHPVSSHPDQEIIMFNTIGNLFNSINVLLNTANRVVNVFDIGVKELEDEAQAHAAKLQETRQARIDSAYS